MNPPIQQSPLVSGGCFDPDSVCDFAVNHHQEQEEAKVKPDIINILAGQLPMNTKFQLAKSNSIDSDRNLEYQLQ